MRISMIIFIFLLSTGIVTASFSSKFDYRKARDILSADAGGFEIDQFLMEYYMQNFQKGDCATNVCTAIESANETDCKCKKLAKGEMCFDIFVSSTASETNPALFPSEAKDYCKDDNTLMEGFVNCAWMDHSYWLEIDCPKGFKCNDGACIHELNTTIGPVFNIIIDDNGTIIYAEYITINGTIIRMLQNATIGNDNKIESADSLILDDILYENISKMQFEDTDLFNVHYTIIPDIIPGGLKITNGYRIFIENKTGEDDFRDIINILMDHGSFILISPIDNSTMLFKGNSNISIKYEDEILDISTKELDVTIGHNITYSQRLDEILNMDIPTYQKLDMIRGLDGLGYTEIENILDLEISDSEKIKLLLEFNIPDPPFVSILGENSLFRVSKEANYLKYYVENATFYFDGGNFKEIVEAKGGSDIFVSLQSGIFCVNLTEMASYRYIDLQNYPSSYHIINKYTDDYMFCSRKVSQEINIPRMGYIDLLQNYVNLTGSILYMRPIEDTLSTVGQFFDLYDSFSDNTVIMDLENEMIKTVRIENIGPILNTFSYMSYFVILEDHNRYAYVTDKKHDYIRYYSTSKTDSDINVKGDTLYQKSYQNIVTIIGPNTKNLYEYEERLSR